MIYQQNDQLTYHNDYIISREQESLDAYITTLARKKIPRAVIPRGLFEFETDELAQITRIKFWLGGKKNVSVDQERTLKLSFPTKQLISCADIRQQARYL